MPSPLPDKVSALVARYRSPLREPEMFQEQLAGIGVPIEPIQDPVLRHLAKYPDEREYVSMLRISEFITPWRAMRNRVLGHGFEILPGPSGNTRLKDYAERIWAGLPEADRKILLKLLLDVAWVGWGPFQIIYGADSLPGETGWLPSKVVNLPHERMRWTREDQPRLVWIPGTAAQPTVFDAAWSDIGWLTPRVGDLRSPYGLGLASFAWPLGQVISALTEASYSSVGKGFGVLKVTVDGGGAMGKNNLQERLSELNSDLETLLKYLNHHNVLVEGQGFTTELLADLDHINSVTELVGHLEMKARMLIQGEHLTSETASSGPAGSSGAHERTARDYALELVGETVEPAVGELFRKVLWLNVPGVDPDDLPVFRSRLRSKVSREVVTTMFATGVPMDAERTAQALGGEAARDLVVHPDDVEDDQILLQNPRTKAATGEPVALPGVPGAPPTPTGGQGAGEDAPEAQSLPEPQRSTRSADLGHGRAVEAAQDGAAGDLQSPLRKRNAQLLRHLRENRPPDPKA